MFLRKGPLMTIDQISNKWLNRLLWPGGIYEICGGNYGHNENDLREWCEVNIPKSQLLSTTSSERPRMYGMLMVLKCKTKEDAVAFKLRWI